MGYFERETVTVAAFTPNKDDSGVRLRSLEMRAAREVKAREGEDELSMQEFHGVGPAPGPALPPARLPPAPVGKLPPPAAPPPRASVRELPYEPETDLSVQRALITDPEISRDLAADDLAKTQQREPSSPSLPNAPRAMGATAALPSAFDPERSVVELRPQPYASVEPTPAPFRSRKPVPPPPDSASRVQIFDGASAPSPAGPALPAFTMPLPACKEPVPEARPVHRAPPPRQVVAPSPWPAPPPGAPPIVYPGPFQLAPAVAAPRPAPAAAMAAFAAAPTRVQPMTMPPVVTSMPAALVQTQRGAKAAPADNDRLRAVSVALAVLALVLLVAGGSAYYAFLTGEGKTPLAQDAARGAHANAASAKAQRGSIPEVDVLHLPKAGQGQPVAVTHAKAAAPVAPREERPVVREERAVAPVVAKSKARRAAPAVASEDAARVTRMPGDDAEPADDEAEAPRPKATKAQGKAARVNGSKVTVPPLPKWRERAPYERPEEEETGVGGLFLDNKTLKSIQGLDKVFEPR